MSVLRCPICGEIFVDFTYFFGRCPKCDADIDNSTADTFEGTEE